MVHKVEDTVELNVFCTVQIVKAVGNTNSPVPIHSQIQLSYSKKDFPYERSCKHQILFTLQVH